MIDFVLLGAGLVILLFAGDALVRGAVNASLRLGIPALIVSLTVVAFGTSAPELLVAIRAAFADAPGIALGNVVGSNTANVLLVLGLPAIMSGLAAGESDTRKSYVIMLGATVLFIVLSFFGPLRWIHGLIMLAALALVLGENLHEARSHRRRGSEVEVEGAEEGMSWRRILIYLGLGLVGLPIGADLMVKGAVAIARDFDISETVIGLTIVALGTSLPELATTVMAAIRREADVALGNIIGSNMFNLLGIMGVTTLLAQVPVDREFLVLDFWVMLASSLLLIPFVFWRQKITRLWGVILTGLYLVYVVVLLS